MDTSKIQTKRRESSRLVSSMVHPSRETPELTKLSSYPMTKKDAKNDAVLTRKLIDRVKNLQKENQVLQSQVTNLKQENKSLNQKWKQTQSCRQLMQQTKTIFTSNDEVRPHRRLSQSFGCCSQFDKSTIGILTKIDEEDENIRAQNIEPLFKFQSHLSFDSCPRTKCFDTELKNRLISYEEKINELLTSNSQLDEKVKTYKRKYMQLKQSFVDALKLVHQRG